MKPYAWLLLIVGLLQMTGALLGQRWLQGLGAATAISPAPKVFSSVKGLETYSTRFYLNWNDAEGAAHELELTSEVCAHLRGPYNRRNVYGAALAYGPVFCSDATGLGLLRPVLAFGMLGEAPLLRELGIEPSGVCDLRLRYEPVGGTSLGELPVSIRIPLE